MVDRLTPSLVAGVVDHARSAGPGGARPSAGRNESARGEVARRGPDRVEVSAVATYLSKSRLSPPIRQDLVDTVRRQIAAGTYDTADKLDAAIDEMLKDIR